MKRETQGDSTITEILKRKKEKKKPVMWREKRQRESLILHVGINGSSRQLTSRTPQRNSLVEMESGDLPWIPTSATRNLVE